MGFGTPLVTASYPYLVWKGSRTSNNKHDWTSVNLICFM